MESRHYTWTYGPTAVFTIVAVFWSRVEFQAKQNAPWQSMLDEPQEPRKSVLLDYISVMQPMSLFQAVTNKHTLVAAGVACSMLLQLLIIFSTGLFSLQQVQVLREDIPAQLTGSLHSLNSSILATVKAQPFDVINGILFANVPYPAGTTRDFVFQTFSVSNLSSDALVTADVSGLSADLDCEPAHIKVQFWQQRKHHVGDSSESRSVVQHNQIYSPSCKVSNVSINLPPAPEPSYSKGIKIGFTLPKAYIQRPKPQYAAGFLSGQCEGASGPDGNRIVLIMAEGQYSKEKWEWPSVFSQNVTVTRNITLKRSTQMICKPTYSLLKLQAKANTTEASLTADLATMTTEQSLLRSLTPWDIASNILAAPVSFGPREPIAYHNPFTASLANDIWTYNEMINVDYSLRVGAWLANTTGNLDDLFQADVLRSTASSYFRTAAAQLVQKGLVAQQYKLLTNSSAVISENRVLMNQMPLRAMEGCLALVILLAGAMIMLAFRDVLAPWNPNYISATAMIIANSKTFCASLEGTSAASLDVLAGRLGGRRYYSDRTAEGLSITTVDDRLHNMTRKDSPVPGWTTKSREWRTFPSLPLRVLFFVMVALVIVALEVLLRLSQADEGLGGASSTGNTHYLWTMLPAVVMEVIGLVFSSIDFNTRCLAPYAQLRKRKCATFNSFMTVNFLDSLDATLIFNSIRLKHYAVLATTLATLASPFLTIITSSLYSAVDVPQRINVTFMEETIFNGTLTGEPGILTANYILRDNLSTPRWTYDELAFPKLAMNNPLPDNLIKNSFVDIRVPAMRAILNCHFRTNADLQPNLTKTGTLEINVPCGRCSANGTNLALNGPLNGTIAISNNAVFGKAFGLVALPIDDLLADKLPIIKIINSDGVVEYRKINDFDTVSYIWGSMRNDSIDHIAGVVCCKYAEMVDTQTRFQLPTFNIMDGDPPRPDENSSRPVLNFNHQLDWAGLDAEELNLDSFFQALVYGKYAIPEEDLSSAETNSKVLRAITRQHKLFKAQLFNSYDRVAVDKVNASLLQGNVSTASHLRVFQDAVATRVLEALLAAMLVCGIVGSVFLNTDRVLPKNPCSIAAVASLLVDSDLLSRYDGCVGDPNHKTVGQTLFANCRFFSEWVRKETGDEPGQDKFVIRLVDYTKNDPPEGWI